MSYFNRQIISNVIIPHPTIELAHTIWTITKALIIGEVLTTLYHEHDPLLALAIAFTLLYIIYKTNEIK